MRFKWKSVHSFRCRLLFINFIALCMHVAHMRIQIELIGSTSIAAKGIKFISMLDNTHSHRSRSGRLNARPHFRAMKISFSHFEYNLKYFRIEC